MNKQKLIFILVFGYTICCQTETLGQTDCSQILQHGIYNYTSTNFQNERLRSLINWFKNENIQTYQEAKGSAFNATVPIDKVLVGLKFSQDEKGFQQLKTFIESYNSQTSVDRTSFAQVIQEIEPGIIQAWTNCIQSGSQGQVLLWVEPTSNPNRFNLCAKYTDIGSGQRKVGELVFNLDKNRISVTDGPFFNSQKVLNATMPITAAVLRQTFKIVGDDDFEINVTGFGAGLSYSLRPSVMKIERTFERRPSNERETRESDESFSTSIILNRIIDKNVMLKIDATYIVTKAANVSAGSCYLAIGDISTPELERSPKYLVNDWVNNVGNNSSGTTTYHKSVEVPYLANSEMKFFAAPQGGVNSIKTASCKIIVSY